MIDLGEHPNVMCISGTACWREYRAKAEILLRLISMQKGIINNHIFQSLQQEPKCSNRVSNGSHRGRGHRATAGNLGAQAD